MSERQTHKEPDRHNRPGTDSAPSHYQQALSGHDPVDSNFEYRGRGFSDSDVDMEAPRIELHRPPYDSHEFPLPYFHTYEASRAAYPQASGAEDFEELDLEEQDFYLTDTAEQPLNFYLASHSPEHDPWSAFGSLQHVPRTPELTLRSLRYNYVQSLRDNESMFAEQGSPLGAQEAPTPITNPPLTSERVPDVEECRDAATVSPDGFALQAVLPYDTPDADTALRAESLQPEQNNGPHVGSLRHPRPSPSHLLEERVLLDLLPSQLSEEAETLDQRDATGLVDASARTISEHGRKTPNKGSVVGHKRSNSPSKTSSIDPINLPMRIPSTSMNLDVKDFERRDKEAYINRGFRTNDDFHQLLKYSYNERNRRCDLEIDIEWDLVQFCDTELDGYINTDFLDQIPRVLTVTCPDEDCDSTQAASCEDYTELVWGSRGVEILRLILTDLLMGGACYFHSTDLAIQAHLSASKEPTEVFLCAQGQPRDVADMLEQFAWLAATFRPASSKYPLSRSEVTIDQSTFDPQKFRLRLQPLARHTEHYCWTSVVPSAVVATGFPIRSRPVRDSKLDGVGLEIPFEIMASLARVSSVTELEGHQILLGPSIVLFPQKIVLSTAHFETAVQWHLVRSEQLTTPDTARELQQFAKSVGEKRRIADLAGLRCFLGYFGEATVHLGTETSTQKEIQTLGLPKSGQGIKFAREGTVTLGFNVPGIINGSVAGKVLLTRGLRIHLGEDRDYEDLLTASKRQSVVLYDVGARTGWLVSELSIVLSLCLVYLGMPDTQLRFRGNFPMVPLAFAAGDGGAAALQTIYSHGDLRLWKKAQDGEFKTFHSVVYDYLRDVRQLRIGSLAHQISSPQILPALHGLEFADIANKCDTVHEKLLPGGMTPSWWPLCAEGRVYTMFQDGLGQVIQPASKVPRGWETVLRGANLLVASMPCIRELHLDARHPNQRDCLCYHITDNVILDPEGETCRDCEVSHKGMVQAMRQLSSYNANTIYRAPRKLPKETGAIIFGDHAEFHRSVAQLHAAINPRRLERHLKEEQTSQVFTNNISQLAKGAFQNLNRFV